MLSESIKARIRVAMANQADADALIAAIDAGSNAQGAAVADIATANASDLASAITLANANKAKINELLGSLRTAAIIAS